MSVVQLFHQIAKNDFAFFQQVRAVSDVMTQDPLCLTLDTTFEAAWNKFRRADVRHAAVLNPEDGQVVGILSDRDLLRQRPRFLGTAAEADGDQTALRESVPRFMSRNPVWCNAEATPVQAMTLMLDHHIDCVVVSPDGKTLQGIVTPQNFIQTLLLYHRVCTRNFDLKRLRLVDLDLQNGIPLDEIFARGAQTVRDIMSKDVMTLNKDDVISTATGLMQEHEFRHLPVLGADGKLIGMLSDRDILKVLPAAKQRSDEPQTRFRQTLFALPDKADKAVLNERVDAVMSKETMAVTPDTLLTDALAMFSQKNVTGLPVIDSVNGKLCGMVTTTDVLRVFRVVMQLGLLADTTAGATGRQPQLVG